MFNEVQGLLQKVTTGEIAQPSVSKAANEHVAGMQSSDVVQNVQTAADNATQNGNTSVAQQLLGLLSNHASDPEGLKQELTSLITSNPQILQHFEPDFAKGILGRV